MRTHKSMTAEELQPYLPIPCLGFSGSHLTAPVIRVEQCSCNPGHDQGGTTPLQQLWLIKSSDTRSFNHTKGRFLPQEVLYHRTTLNTSKPSFSQQSLPAREPGPSCSGERFVVSLPATCLLPTSMHSFKVQRDTQKKAGGTERNQCQNKQIAFKWFGTLKMRGCIFSLHTSSSRCFSFVPMTVGEWTHLPHLAPCWW